ncbi:MAG: hypothetical protein P4L69_16460 [Desulfosporosinus sp.]|nr:hypothetical protein [Desulfosporosinus sp.]
MTPAEVSTLASVLASGAEIECLNLWKDLPEGAGVELGKAITCHNRISALSLGYESEWEERAPGLIQLVAVSASAALQQLCIKGLYLDDNCMQRLCDSFKGFTTLLRLSIVYCHFDTPSLVKRVGELQALKSVNISKVSLFDSDADTLVESLLKLPMMTDLEVCDININTENYRKIGGLIAARRIRKLVLRGNELANDGVSVMVDAVRYSKQKMCKLEELCLSGNEIGPEGAQKIAELVARSPYLRHLNLSSNPIGETAVGSLVECASSMQELDISNCELCERGGVLLITSPAYPALTALKMSNNRMDNLSAGAIVQSLLLPGGRTLKELDMSKNYIKETGALELAKGLANAYALQSINMTGNQLGIFGSAKVLDALATASTAPMHIIDFRRCYVGDDGGEAVGKLIRNRGCICIRLDHNQLNYRGVRAIADSINDSPCVIELLGLDMNPLCDAIVEYLLNKILQQNKFVCELSIDLLRVRRKEAMVIKRATEVLGSLKVLSYIGNIRNKEAKSILKEVRSAEHVLKYKGAAILVHKDTPADKNDA